MTRFDATEPADRRKLYVDAITAHRERGQGFLTLEADPDSLEGEATDPDPDLGVPWVQFADGTINVDCTDAEYDELTSLLESYPAFKVEELTRPEDAEGANVRVSAKADANRIAQFVDGVFLHVYGLPESVRVWVVDL